MLTQFNNECNNFIHSFIQKRIYTQSRIHL